MNTQAANKNLTTYQIKGIPLPMITVAPGRFRMGDDASGYDDEKPEHWVDIKAPFQMAQYPVTQELWETLMGDNPSRFIGASRPVEQVSWLDIRKGAEGKPAFLDLLNNTEEAQKIYEAEGKRFCLPSEAEWEFAARGGIHAQGYAYCGSDQLKQVGWYSENSGNETKPVGLLLPNELGLYDMSGNVFEWCEDDWHGSYDDPKRPDDGSPWVDAPKRGISRVFRGGSYFSSPINCRPALRYGWRADERDYFVGFRLVLSLQTDG